MSTKDTSVKVEKIVITIGEETLELTPAQAKEMHRELDKLYGKKDAYKRFPVVPSYNPFRYRDSWWAEPHQHPPTLVDRITLGDYDSGCHDADFALDMNEMMIAAGV